DPLFSSAALEMAFLRELSDALVRNLFPRSFWGQETYHCLLVPVFAGLGLLVNWLSDPDNLNQLAVNQLDSVALKSSAEELPASDPDHTSVAPQEGEGDEEGSEVNSLGAEISTSTGLVCKRRGMFADWEDSELIFAVHLEEKDSPENLQWDIKKTYMDVVHFRNRWQELVSDSMIGHTLPVFQFLCPLDKLLNEEEQFGGVWGILSGLACFLTPGQEEEENGSPFPTIVVSQYNSPPQQPEETEVNPQPAANADTSHENSFQEKPEDSDCTLTSHFKTMFSGKSRSQESLSSTKGSGDEEQPEETQQAGAEELSQLSCCSKSFKKERTCFRMSGGAGKMKGKETTQGPLQRGEDSKFQRGQGNWEQLESTKAIFDLLKEISGLFTL
ncbi:hypothetical protein GOODEAATRI_005613, partial [Goodea atripinnis]